MNVNVITPKRVKTALICFLVALAGILALFFLLSDRLEKAELKNIEIDSAADLKLKQIEQISTRNGIKEWSLKAASAKFFKEKNQARLKDLSVVFYTQNGEKVHLKANTGVLHTKTENLTLSDHVVVTYQDYVLTTDKLHYEKKRHIIYTNTAVEINRGESVIFSDTMVTDLNTYTTRLEGNIRGRFSEDLAVM